MFSVTLPAGIIMGSIFGGFNSWVSCPGWIVSFRSFELRIMTQRAK